MRPKKTVLAAGVIVVMELWFLSGAVEAGQANAQQRELSSPQPNSPVGRISLTVHNGRLTASVQESPIGSVLEKLDSQTDVALIPAEDVDIAEHRISAQLADVPLDEGLRRLLKDYDTFFYYGGVGNAPSSLQAVWIYPKGTASALRPVPPEAWASSKELEASVADWFPEVRERAYEALMLRPGSAGRERVLQAIRGVSETDEAVRQRLLSSAISNGMRLPPDLIADLARWDGSEGIRLMALDALAGDPIVEEIAQAALTDSSQTIRKRAKEILAELGAR
jgi:hypothetical protein